MTPAWPAVERLLSLADSLGGAWSARARASTTIGRERALLRLVGVDGLDRAGQPLAARVVERYLARDGRRLAGGLLLPFAVALLEYESTPQQLALDAASGAVDLGLEAELLQDPGRRAAAETLALELAADALERIDAGRTAARELRDALGDPVRPWLGATLGEPNADEGRAEARHLAAGGVDVVRVRVPAGRELAERLRAVGLEPPLWRPRTAVPVGREPAEEAPAGSQRGLAALREVLDEAAAERSAYVRLMTTAAALSAPEQAVVAAFERVDLVEADPVGEIVEGRVDPDRALADHADARRLLARAGAGVLVGAGPLVVGPDLARGLPAAAPERAGRALALQALAVALARHDGIRPERLLVGALPTWLPDERDPGAQAIAAVALRRAVFPDLGLVFDEPPLEPRAAARWPFLLAAALPWAGGAAALVLRRVEAGSLSATAWGTRAAAELAVASAAARPAGLVGPAREHADAALAAAVATLQRLADEGWPAVLGPASPPPDRLGSDAVAERTDAFDPLAVRRP
ncbi:MAG TPA: lysine 5,6-aminomutase subunit alpha [Candidatus Limnocylindrales bacterium]